MNTRLPLTMLLLALSGSMHANDDAALPLPRWSEEELRALQAGRTPLGFGVLLNPDGDGELAPLNLADSPDHQQPRSDLSRFLPSSLLATPMRQDKPPHPTIALARVINDVSNVFLEQAKQAPTAMLLIDPNGELHESAQEEFHRFLEFHARDCSITLRVLLMDTDEQLPPDLKVSKLADGSLNHGRVCLAVVPMGDVARTRLFLSRDVITAASDVDLTELLADVVKQAKSSPEPEEQLHRLLVRLSVRVFQLENKLPTPTQNETIRPAIVVAKSDARLMEVGAPRKSVWSLWKVLGWITALSCIGVFVLRRWTQHKRRTHEWVLPERSRLLQRFGGAHCGGASGVAW